MIIYYVWVTGTIFMVATMASNHCFTPDTAQYSTVNVWCAIYTNMVASMHYGLMALNNQPTFKIILKYSDWLISLPVMRLQICVILRIHDKEILGTSMMCTVAMLLMGFVGEVATSFDVKIMLGFWAAMVSEYSTYVLERHYRGLEFHHLYNFQKNMCRMYGVLYLVGAMPWPYAADLASSLQGVGDVMMKGSLMAFALMENNV